MSDQELDYAAIRRNVEQAITRRKRLYRMIFFVTHLVLFLVSMAVVWGTAIADSQLRSALFDNGLAGALVLVLPTLLWVFMLFCHVSMLYIESEAGEKAMREQVLRSEVSEEILRKGLSGELGKPKRRAAARVMMSDDGELVEPDETQHNYSVSNNTSHS